MCSYAAKVRLRRRSLIGDYLFLIFFLPRGRLAENYHFSIAEESCRGCFAAIPNYAQLLELVQTIRSALGIGGTIITFHPKIIPEVITIRSGVVNDAIHLLSRRDRDVERRRRRSPRG